MRVLLAARLSKKSQRGEGLGIETQDERMREWCDRNGYEVIDIAADSQSGIVMPWDRKNLRKWVTRPEKIASYDAIVAYSIDRLTRGEWKDEVRIRLWAQDHGKVLMTESGAHWPPRNDGDRWRWESEVVSARKEWEQDRERSMRAQAKLIENGKLVGRPIFGYAVFGTKYDKTMIPTDAGREFVPQIFQRIADGDSLAKVAAWLNSEGIKTQQGNLWSGAQIRKLIINRTYTGSRQTEDGKTVLQVEALVDAKLWLAANDRLKSEKRGRRGPISDKPALLTGVLFCGRCHAPMYKFRMSYRCAGKYPDRKGCGNVIPLVLTDAMVTHYLSQASDPWTEMRQIKGINSDARREEIQLELDDLPRRRLSREDEQSERERLWAEQDDLPASTPDRWEPVDMHITVGRHWASLDYDGQREMLLDAVRIHAEARPDLPGGVVLGVDSRLFRIPVTWIEI